MANGGRIDYSIGFNVDKTGLNQIKSSLQEIKNLTAQDIMRIGGHSDIKKAENELKALKTSISQIDGALDRAFNTDLGTLNVSKFNQALKGLNLNKVYQDFSKAGVAGQTAFRNVTSQILTTNMQLKQTHSFINNMATTMANTVKWGAASSVMNGFTRNVQKAYGYVKSLDTSLNDIRIVTGKSADEMERFAVKANNAAKELGKSTTDYTKASLIYYQQGLSDEDVAARAETTLKAANVTGQSGEAVSEQLTAVWNGYKVSAEEAELYIDKLAAVAATTAADLEELSTGMSKVASAADLMGVDIDQLNAQMATIVSVTRQAPESVGTALKTIYARMGDIESGLDAETTLGHYTEEMKAMGVNVLDANGKLRDMGSVIEEIGGKWQSMSREQQIALSQTMAGTRQYNNLLSLFDNWDMYTKALETSANAAGTLQEQQDTYMESTQAHLNQLRAASEDLYDSLLDPKGLNPLIDGLTIVTNLFANFVDSIGGGSGVLLGLGTLGTKVFSQQIATGLATTIKNLQNTKYNAEQVSAQFQVLNQFKGLNIKDDTTQKLIKWKEELLQLGSLVTAEQHNEANALMQSTVEIQNQADAWEINKQNVEKYLQASNVNKGSITGISQDSSKFNKIDSILNQRIKNYEKGQQAAQNLQKAIDDLNSAFYKEAQATGDFTAAERESARALEEVESAMAKNIDVMEMREGSLRILASESEEYKNLSKAIQEYKEAINAPEKEDVTIRNKAQALVEAYQAANNKLKSLAVDARNTVSREANGASQEFQASIRNAEAEMEHFKKSLQITGQINSIVKSISGLGSMAMALNSLSRIGSIFDDESLTSSEKMLQIMMSFSIAAPALGASFSELTKGYGAVRDVMNATQKATLLAKEAEEAKIIADELAIKASQESYLVDAAEVAMCEAEALALDAETAAQGREAVMQKLANSEEKKSIGIKMALLAIQHPIATAIGVGLVAAIGASIFAWQRHNKAIKESIETLENGISDLESSTSELENLESSLKGVQDQLDELYSKGELSITDKEDIANLERERIELETQLALQKEINAEKQKQVANDAKQAIDKGAFEHSATYEVGKGQFIDVSTEETRDAWIEEQVKKHGENYRERATELANEYYDKYHDEFVNSLAEDYDTLMASLDALKETGGSEEDIAYLQNKITEYYNAMGTLDDTVLSSMDSVFQGDTAQQNQFHEALQSGDPTADSGWTDEDLTKAGLAEEQIEALKVAADAAGISLDTLVNTYKELGNEEIAGTFENNINKIKAGVEGENQSFDSSEAESVVTDLQDQYGVDDEFINRALEKIDFSKIDYDNFAESLKGAMEQAMAEQSQEDIESEEQAFDQKSSDIAAEFDFDEENYKKLIENIAETAKTSEELDGALEENGEIAQEVAKDLMRYDKACESVKDSSEDWMKALESGNLQDQSEAIEEMADAYGNLLDIDGDALSQDFLTNTENLELMKQAANGSEEAYNSLQAAAAQDILMSLGYTGDEAKAQFENDLAYVQSFNSDTFGNIADLAVGAELNDEAFLQGLTDMVNAAGMTADEATSYLSSMGVDAEVVTNTETTPEMSTVISGYTPVVSWDSKSFNIGPAEFDYKVPKLSFKTQTEQIATGKQIAANSLKVTSANKSSGGGFKHKNSSHGGGNKGGGKSGGGGGGGGGGSSKPKTEKKIESKKDRYHDVNARLSQIDDQLEDIGKDQEKLFGKDLIDSLNEELEILEKQRDTLKEKLDIARQEQAELQNTLRQSGVDFNADGTIANYLSIIEQKEAEYNALIDQYNAMDAASQENFKETVLDPAKENLDKLYEDIQAYDDLILDTIPEIENGLDDITDREVEINIQKMNMEMELRLDLVEARKDWNDFKREVLDNLDDEDLFGNALADKELFEQIWDSKALKAGADELKEIIGEINDINETGSSDIFGEDKQAALEELKTSMEDLMGVMEELDALQEAIAEGYLESIDKVADAFDGQVESYEFVNDLVQHNLDMIELLHGDDAYAEMAKSYEQMEKNNLDIVAANKQAVDYYKQMMETETDPEAVKKWEELWTDAVSNLNDSVEESAQTIIDKYTNTINQIFDELNDKLTNGKGLDYVNLEWELSNENQDAYLDAINSEYELQQLERKYRDSINSADSISAQRSLNKLMDEELKKLREKDKLTQYDIDRANAKYELRLKEIALEEAQQNKTQMRLRRDSSGNYSYQFVADQDSVSAAQQEVDEARNSLYNMDKDAYRENQQAILDVWNEYQEKMRDSANLSAEERALIQQQYEERINGLLEENTAIRLNLTESAMTELTALYDQNAVDFQNMTDAEKQIIWESLIPNWDNGVQQMAKTFVDEGGFLPTCQDAFNQLDQATVDYNNSLQLLESTAGTSFGAMAEGYNENIGLAEELAEKQQENIDNCIEEQQKIADLRTEVDNLAASYKAVWDNAAGALTAAQELLTWEQEKAAREAEEERLRKEQEQQQQQGSGGGSSSGGSGSGGGSNQGLTSDVIDGVAGAIYYWTPAAWGTGNERKQKIESKFGAGSYNKIQGYINQHVDMAGNLKQQFKYGWGERDKYKNYYYSKFDTGGYTGDWIGEDGKLAMLHQKELVLNADDTQNFLAAISMVRDMSGIFEAMNDSILSRVTGMANALTPQAMNSGMEQNELNQNVNIQASFPGVSSRAEIEQAFANLVNMASQHAYNTRR